MCLEMNFGEKKIKGLLLDITGVLYESGDGYGSAINGSVEAIERIVESGIPFRLVSNESTSSNEYLFNKLRHHGFNIQQSQIFTPIPAVKSIIKKKNLRPYIVVHDNICEDFDDIDQTNPNCVVMGDAEENFSFTKMNEAFNILLTNPTLFTLGKGKYYRHKGKLQLDVGPFSKALEYACGIDSIVIGKPSPDYFATALADINVEPSQAIMIGDDIVSDVGGAQQCGLGGILVKTGKFTSSNLCHPSVKPDFIADNLYHAIDILLMNK